VLITSISQSYALQLQVVFNESLANLQRYHYVMTLLVEAHHY